jgi:chemotaxis phosphatase CheX-like protein
MPDAITSERAVEVIGEAAAEVLETMFFTVVEPEPCVPSEEIVCARLTFSGSWVGMLEVSLPAESVNVMATDFLGLGFEEEPTMEQINNVFGELVNMICGVALSRLEPEGRFELNSPASLESLTEAEDSPRTALELEHGPMTIQLLTR